MTTAKGESSRNLHSIKPDVTVTAGHCSTYSTADSRSNKRPCGWFKKFCSVIRRPRTRSPFSVPTNLQVIYFLSDKLVAFDLSQGLEIDTCSSTPAC
ncbi:hypothetical protein TNCV_4132211 [Trichonephila clavipes]|nr:hypothetical protein TNCV_4132211 [Trichonephila clavipes]